MATADSPRSRTRWSLLATLLVVLGALVSTAPPAVALATAAAITPSSNQEVTEGDTLAFTVTLDTAATTAVTIRATTRGRGGRPASPGSDIQASDEVTIPGGARVGTLRLAVVDDDRDEQSPEGFAVDFEHVSGDPVTITPTSVNGSIADDDPPPSLSISDTTVAEGAGTATFEVTLSAVTDKTVSVDATVEHGSAGPADVGSLTPASLTWPAGTTDLTRTLTIDVVDDQRDEPSETLDVVLENPLNATLQDGRGQLTINDDDPAPTLAVSSPSAREGEDLEFVVSLDRASARTVTVTVTVEDVTTSAGDWSGARTRMLTFPADLTSQTVVVPTVEDGAGEDNETLRLRLSAATNAALPDPPFGTGTISETGPAVRAAVTTASPREGTPVSFGSDGTSGPGSLSYSWDFGDGTPAATTPDPVHTYVDDGEYTVTLTVTDGNGQQGTASLTIRVANVVPTVAIRGAASVRNVGVTRSATFVADVSDPGADREATSVVFDWGDGTASSPIAVAEDGTATASHAWESTGLFLVVAVATDDEGTSPDCGADDTLPQCAQVVVTTNGTVVRSFGPDRVATAANVARDNWDDGAPAVLVARRDDFPDALAAVALAAQLDAPLLLTRSTALDPEVADVIGELGPSRAFLLGGTSALSEDVFAAIDALVDDVERISGPTRFATAAAVARAVGPPANATAVVTLGQLADGVAWADALSAGAYRGRMPLLLTRRDALPDETRTALIDLGVTQVVVVGGTAAVSDAVLAEIDAIDGVSARRVRGPNRYATSAAVAADALDLFGQVADVVVATGRNFPDGLAAGAVAARLDAVMVLVHTAPLADRTPEVAQFLSDRRTMFDRGLVVGGTAAVSTELERQVRDAID